MHRSDESDWTQRWKEGTNKARTPTTLDIEAQTLSTRLHHRTNRTRYKAKAKKRTKRMTKPIDAREEAMVSEANQTEFGGKKPQAFATKRTKRVKNKSTSRGLEETSSNDDHGSPKRKTKHKKKIMSTREIGKLTALTWLDFDANSFTGT